MAEWSWRKLVAEYGEEIAILLLEFMEGYGEFDAKISHWEYRTDTPYDDVHDYLPIALPATPLSEYTELDYGASGVLITLWRKGNTSST